MKMLLLTRHAKSDWAHPGLADHDRPLNKRGESDAPRMADFLAGNYTPPQSIISSTAVRARTTAEVLAGAFGEHAPDIVLEPNLYLADTHTLLEVTRGLPDALTTVMLTGHNPGMTDYLNLLTGGRIDDLPTCSVARVGFELEHWAGIRPGLGTLLSLDTPTGLPGKD